MNKINLTQGQSYCSASRVLTMHIDDPSLTPDTQQGPQSTNRSGP